MGLLDVHVGAIGFEHPDWRPGYYPDDLPEDWRLEYYANNHETLLLPAGRLLTADGEELQSWYEDTEDEFRFFLHGPGSLKTHEYAGLAANAACLREKFSGILLDTADAQLATALAATFGPSIPHAIVMGPSAGSERSPAPTYWQPGAAGTAGSGVAVGCLEAPAVELPRLRDQLMAFIAWCGQREDSWLFLGGTPPNPESLSQARLMLDLLIG